ncbi:MAG: hypothetical protein ACKO34_01895 [Vampirovibrionales bacterium]
MDLRIQGGVFVRGLASVGLALLGVASGCLVMLKSEATPTTATNSVATPPANAHLPSDTPTYTPNHKNEGGVWVIVSTPFLSPSQVNKRKAFGDASWMMGNDLADSLRLQLPKTQRVFSPADVWTAVVEANAQTAVTELLTAQQQGRGVSFPQLVVLQQALQKKYSISLPFYKLLVLESNLDFTQPYAPNTLNEKVTGWLTGNLTQHEKVYVFSNVYQYSLLTPTAPLLDRFQWQGVMNGDTLVANLPSVTAHPSTRVAFQGVSRQLAKAYCDPKVTLESRLPRLPNTPWRQQPKASPLLIHPRCT